MQLAISPEPIWLILKVFFIIGLSVYSIFAFVVIRQTQIMTSTVKLQFEGIIKLIALIHFVFAICLLIVAIFVL
jgi:Family of unknown function (DUF5657)